MTKTKLIVVASFLVVFVAGALLGVLLGRLVRHPRQGFSLSRELNLTAEQRDKMQEIWSNAMGPAGHDYGERRREFQKERDDAVKALLNDEQKLRYEELMQEYARKMTVLSEERKKPFEQAQALMKQMLTPPQLKKYEDLLKRRTEGGGRPRSRGRERMPEAQNTPHGEEWPSAGSTR